MSPPPGRKAGEPTRGMGRLLAAAVLTGVAAGVGGIVLTLLLHLVQHLAFGYTEDSFLVGVEKASGRRRLAAMTGGGAVVGLGWWALWHRYGVRGRPAPLVSVEKAMRNPATPLPALSTAADAVLQIMAVGFGASLGREGAPRQVGAAAGALIAGRAGLDAGARRMLMACGAGAGLAAVYNVPISGALFTVEAVLASFSLRNLLLAFLSAATAAATALPVLSGRPTYAVGPLVLSPSLLVWAVLIGPFAALAGSALLAGAGAARRLAPTGWRLPVATTLVFAAVGALSIGFPQLLGNGKGPTQLALDTGIGVSVNAALLVGKPLVTVACLASGARGGLLTPAFATGALLGALAGGAWTALWPAPTVAGFVLVGAAAVLAVTLRAPLCAVALALELTHSGWNLAVPIAVAVAGAVLCTRLIRSFTGQRHES